MKRSVSTVLALGCAAVALLLGSTASAQVGRTPSISPSTAAISTQEFMLSSCGWGGANFVRICGSKVAWSDYTGVGLTQAVLYDLVTGEKTVISGPTEWCWDLAISEKWAVWQDANSAGDVHVYDITTGEDRIMWSVPGGLPASFSISGDKVAYTADQLYVYDIVNQESLAISTAPGDHVRPAISGDTVVWTEWRNQAPSQGDIYLYDLSEQKETAICTDPGNQWSIGVSGDHVAWVDESTGALWIYTISTDQAHVVSGTYSVGRGAISGDTVVWEDARNGNHDIYVYDISSGQQQAICQDAAEQRCPAVSGTTVVWIDRRHAEDATYDNRESIFAVSADYVEHCPPVTSVAASVPPAHVFNGGWESGWTKASVTVALAAREPEPGSGLAYTEWRFNSGAWSTGTDAPLDVAADHSKDGPYVLGYRSVDILGNVESEQTLALGIDTRRPATKAPYTASVRRYALATLKYKVTDSLPNEGHAQVLIKVRNRAGRVVKLLGPAWTRVNRVRPLAFTCKLPRGTYKFSVYAYDAAGNKQANVASNKLVVR